MKHDRQMSGLNGYPATTRGLVPLASDLEGAMYESEVLSELWNAHGRPE